MVKASGNEYLSSIEESIVSLINFIRQGNIVDETEECIHESDVSWWKEYERIQSDIFDHLLVMVQKFDLKLYQYSD